MFLDHLSMIIITLYFSLLSANFKSRYSRLYWSGTYLSVYVPLIPILEPLFDGYNPLIRHCK